MMVHQRQRKSASFLELPQCFLQIAHMLFLLRFPATHWWDKSFCTVMFKKRQIRDIQRERKGQRNRDRERQRFI